MAPKRELTRYRLLGLVALLLAAGIVIYGYRGPLWETLVGAYSFFSDQEKVRTLIAGFGPLAPFIFMAFQILQVLFAPIPGEATGFIGGYLFGSLAGFLYSSIALTIGSIFNFMIGRLLGKGFVERIMPPAKLDKYERFLKRQGIIVVFLLFVFPGFPKDSLCFFLGLSSLPLKVFILICALGRMPGTLMLSLQGAFLFEHKYGMLVLVFGIGLVMAYLTFHYREKIYAWMEKMNHTPQKED